LLVNTIRQMAVGHCNQRRRQNSTSNPNPNLLWPWTAISYSFNLQSSPVTLLIQRGLGLMLWRCWSWRLFHVVWTTATHFSTAYPMYPWPGCSLSRMLLHVSCRALDGMTTSRRCYTSCTGFRFRSGWILR